MKTIWKFPLQITDYQIVIAPVGAQLLSVQAQNGVPCIWALVDPSHTNRPYNIYCFGTGHPVPPEMALVFIDTVQLYDGSLVFHFFYEQ